MNKTQSRGIKAREGITYLDVSHLDRELTFIYPAKGPNNYFNVRERILESNLRTPTMSQNASLVYSAWQNPKEKYSKEIIDILRNSWLWGFNGILYVPKEGAYIQDNPEVKDSKVVMNKSGLVKKLKSNDPTVRFVEFGSYKPGEQTSKELAENKFVQALASEEGAQKLAEVSTNYKFKPYVWSFNNVDEEFTRVAALLSLWGGNRLYVASSSDDVSGCGCALGVSEAS